MSLINKLYYNPVTQGLKWTFLVLLVFFFADRSHDWPGMFKEVLYGRTLTEFKFGENISSKTVHAANSNDISTGRVIADKYVRNVKLNYHLSEPTVHASDFYKTFPTYNKPSQKYLAFLNKESKKNNVSPVFSTCLMYAESNARISIGLHPNGEDWGPFAINAPTWDTIEGRKLIGHLNWKNDPYDNALAYLIILTQDPRGLKNWSASRIVPSGTGWQQTFDHIKKTNNKLTTSLSELGGYFYEIIDMNFYVSFNVTAYVSKSNSSRYYKL